MKKLAILLVSIAASASLFAQTTVGSDIVGYSKVTVPSNQMVLVALAFDNPSNTVGGVFNSLPPGTIISFWDVSSQKYKTAAKTRSGWGSFATNLLKRGEGLFLNLPTNTQQDVLFSGAIPTNSTTAVYPVNGLSMLSYPYPVNNKFTNTVLAKSGNIGDQVSFWSNGWITVAKTRSGWLSATGVTLRIGQAFFYTSTNNATRNETIPYTIN